MRGAFADTQVARGAMCLKMLQTDRSRRRYRRLTLSLFIPAAAAATFWACAITLGVAAAVVSPASKKRRLEASVTCFSVLRGVV